jgi:hypothetical protein
LDSTPIAKVSAAGAANLRRAAALTAIVALSLALGGCLISRRPLFAETSAVAALGGGGRYVAYRRVGAGYRRDETVELRRHDRGYDYVNEKGAVTPLTLHPLGGALFAVQARTEGGDYVYARLRLRGRVGFVAIADCGARDMRKLAALGVVAQANAFARVLGSGGGAQTRDCVLDGVRDPRKLFSALDFGAPTGKLAPQ